MNNYNQKENVVCAEIHQNENEVDNNMAVDKHDDELLNNDHITNDNRLDEIVETSEILINNSDDICHSVIVNDNSFVQQNETTFEDNIIIQHNINDINSIIHEKDKTVQNTIETDIINENNGDDSFNDKSESIVTHLLWTTTTS